MLEYLNDKVTILHYKVDKWGERNLSYEFTTYGRKENIREMRVEVEGKEVLMKGSFLIKADVDVDFGDEIQHNGKTYKVAKIEVGRAFSDMFKRVYVI